MFNKILVAVDGSERAKKALNQALEVAEKSAGGITLIHVYSTAIPLVSPTVDTAAPTGMPLPTSAAIAARIVEESQRKGQEILNEAEAVVKARGVSVEKVLKEGDAVKEIVAEAEREKSDLIVMGHRGLSKLGELLLGSVSEGVAHKAPCTVMIVK